MSASSKKKLRNAQEAEMLTERQLAQQKEAKKLKILTTVMVVVLAVMVVFAAYTAISNGVNASGMLQRKAVAATVGDHELSAVEYNCFFIDAVSNFYGQYGSYASLFGLDVTKALDKQTYDEEAGTTWADYFKDTAEANIKSVYAIVDEAEVNGFALTEEDKKAIDSQMSSLLLNAVYYGYSNLDSYLTAMYGAGADEETVRGYVEKCYTAQAYQNKVAESMEYTDADLQAKDDEDPTAYTFYSYNSYYLSTSKFLTGGTVGEDDKVTYSEEERAAALAAAEEAAKSLVNDSITSVKDLDIAIKGLEINKDAETAASSAYTDTQYGYIPAAIQEWVADESRVAGDLVYLPSTTTTTVEDPDHDHEADPDHEHETVTTTTGFYVVYFNGRNDNEVLLKNVRHILLQFEGGTTDTNGKKTYSDEEKAAALEKANEVYEQWKSGEATEDSFAALANEKSADSDGTDGGLYTDVYPGQMVTAFNDWCFDEARQAGDTEIVETEFGYHIMYFSGNSEQTYREFMIENTLLNEDIQAWHDALVEAITLTKGEQKYVPTGMVLGASN